MSENWIDYLIAESGLLADDNGALSLSFELARDASECGVAAVPLLHLGLMRVSGEDNAAFLHNLLSNSVSDLPEAQAQWTSLNTPKGRMLANFLLWREDADCLLALSRDLQTEMQKKLSMYILRSKVRLLDANNELALIGVVGIGAEHRLQAAGCFVPPAAPAPRLGTMGDSTMRVIRLDETCFIVAAPSSMAADTYRKLLAAGCLKAGTDVWRLAMIRRGLPLVTAPTQEAFVAQMLNFDVIGGIRTGRGCYPGQEIITRARSLGKVKRRLYRLAVSASMPPAAGMNLYSPEADGQLAGTIVNVATVSANAYEVLAVMRIGSVEGGTACLGKTDGPRLSVLELPYTVPV